MNQPDKQELLRKAVAKLKRATQFAESLLDNPVRVESCSTLWTLTGEANGAVNALRSAAAGNPEPKVG